MARPGRNDPCHCGSGKKYKKCCLPAEEVVEAQARAVRQQALEATMSAERARHRDFRRALAAAAEDRAADEAYVARSNAVLDLIHAGKLDEAETAARELMRDEPEGPDGLEHLGFVYEKRGDGRTAARLYREAVDLWRSYDDPLNEDHINWLIDLANRIEGAASDSAS